mgnify:FL=1
MQITEVNDKKIKVSVGLLIERNKILISSRKENKIYNRLWEFPGGKVKKNESTINALRRELNEELSINIDLNYTELYSNYSYKYKESCVDLYFFTCIKWTGKVFPLEGQKIEWLKRNEIKDSRLLPSNIIILNKIRKDLLI